MDEIDVLAQRFEQDRAHLRAVAYRMLGSISEADDAVQEAWLRLHRSDTAAVTSLTAWLTTVVGRICLNMLRSRKSRREDPLDAHVPDPIVGRLDTAAPEEEAILVDSVGLALLVVLETLTPAERLAFVLHDMFGMPFDEIAPIVDRTPTAARQLASRARRRVRGNTAVPGAAGGRAAVHEADRARQREVVDAFLAAAREGDFGALVAILDPDVLLRADGGPTAESATVRGARAVAGQALRFARLARYARPAMVNGSVGLVVAPEGVPVAVMGIAVRDGRVLELDILADITRLRGLDLTLLDD